MPKTGRDPSRRLKILFVCFPYSVHAARWTRLLDGAGHDLHVFPSQPNHHLHEEFRDITFWPVPDLAFSVGDRPIRIGTLPELPLSDPETRLAALISVGQFDIVHSLEFQHAGYLTLKSLSRVPDRRPIWIATNYGSDISLLGRDPEHASLIQKIVSECDYYSAECHRDVSLAREFGLCKPVFAVCPNSGGIDIELTSRLRSTGPTSARRVVAVKGYQHFAGRALTALQAIDLVRDRLQDYRVCIFSPFPEVRQEAERLRSQRGIDVECLPEQVPHTDILQLHARARVSVAISVGDGISTALLEAMAMGSFPIQTCTACADEWIIDGKSGFIVRPDDVEQIADRLRRALNDDDLVDSAAKLNLERIHACASREVVAAQVRGAYAQIPLSNPWPEPLPDPDQSPTRIVLSVITPTYNRSSYLKETIDSVLMQRFVGLQYIVMDDGSTDDTGTLVRTYGDRIEYHYHENVGEQRSVNRALGLVRGDFFMIVNSDDPVLPDSLTKMVGALRGNPLALAAYPDWRVIDSESNPMAIIEVGDFNFARMLASLSISIGPGACFRRSVLELVGYRNPLLRYSADLDYWFRIALAGEIIHVPQTLATHRTHAGSAIVAERGGLMSREVSYLFETYSRHPRSPRRTSAVEDAHGHFVAAFVCGELRSATRELLRSLLVNPITFFARLEQHSADATRQLLERLGGEAEDGAPAPLRTLEAARSRSSAYRIVARAALRDPVACLQTAGEIGSPHLINWIRQLPLVPQFRRAGVLGDGRIHFAAAFVCIELRSATRELLRSLLVNPITFFACLEQRGADATIKHLERLGGETRANAAPAFGALGAATSRRSAYRLLARAALRDPVVCLQAAMEIGVPRLVAWVQQLPIESEPRSPPLSRLFMNLNAIYRHPFNRDKRREFLRNQLTISWRPLPRFLIAGDDPPSEGPTQAARGQRSKTPLAAVFKASRHPRLLLNLNAIHRHPLNRDKRREFRRNSTTNASMHAAREQPAAASKQPEGGREQPAETTLDAAFKAMGVEDPHLAAHLFDEAIGSDLEAAPSGALHQYGVALAWVGRLDDAERALRLAFKRAPDAFLAYRFGSVLAEQRKFSEAMAAFAAVDHPQPWLSGGSMRSIWFPARKDEMDAFEVPFRRTVRDLFDGSVGDRDFVYFVAADSRYAKQFARALHSSLAAVQANCLLHIHIINPDAATSALLGYMKERPGPFTAFSSEEVDLSDLSNDQRRVYYASARFLVLSALCRHYGKPVIAADIDQIVLKDPGLLIEPGSDVAAIRFPYGRFNLMARFSASAIIASTPAAATYFERVAAYIAGRMRDRAAIAWHLDQIALDVAHLVSDDIVLSELPQGAMLSAGPDADVPDDTYFWSVTYSIVANARKLAHPIFQKLENAPLIVVTPVYDDSKALTRTIASVARGGYSNVAHVMIDHRRIVDGPPNGENAGRVSLVTWRSGEDEASLTDLMRAMPNATFLELLPGQELEQGTLFEVMLAIETGGYRLNVMRDDGSELIDLVPPVGLGSEGERLTIFRKRGWTDDYLLKVDLFAQR